MEISEVRVKLVANKDDRLKAFCSITMDNEFVVRDIKVIEGASGFFVAMPSRKMSDHCEKCGGKNHLRAKFCNNCSFILPFTSFLARFSISAAPQLLQNLALRWFLPPHFSQWSLIFLEGIATKKPLAPSITLMSRTTNSLSIVIEQKAFNLSSLLATNLTLTSVIS